MMKGLGQEIKLSAANHMIKATCIIVVNSSPFSNSLSLAVTGLQNNAESEVFTEQDCNTVGYFFVFTVFQILNFVKIKYTQFST